MADKKKSKGEILDSIFKNPEVKYGLTVFSKREMDALTLREEKDNKYYVSCPVSEKKKLAKPEETIRQLVLNKLMSELNYPRERIDIEVPIKMGSTYASKAADIVVYKEDSKETPHIIIEVKNSMGCNVSLYSFLITFLYLSS